MCSSARLSLLCALTASSFFAGRALAGYQVAPLNYPGSTSTIPYSITSSGVIGYYTDAGGVYHGFHYSGGNFQSIDYSPGNSNVTGTVTLAQEGSKIVGYTIAPDNAENGAFFDGSTWSTLNDPNAVTGNMNEGTLITSISGNTLAGFYNGADGNMHGFSYDGSNWTTLDDPNAAGSTEILGMSGGTMVGTYEGADLHTHGFFQDAGGWHALDVPGADATFAYAIDGSDIVGYYVANLHATGFIYDGTSFTDFSNPADPGTDYPLLGKSGDALIGYTVTTSGSFSQHGFIATIAPEPASLAAIAPVALLFLRKKR